ncbi:MAG: hypothetical protein QOK15_747 [Nocardioidaceae bacterium]|nr:hypothetical protein [Nocardioidaceae bacterium]
MTNLQPGRWSPEDREGSAELAGELLDRAVQDTDRFKSLARAQARELAQLHSALETRPLIDQAKGVVMACFCLDEARAFEVLARWSQNTNVKLRVLAEAVVHVASARPGPPPAHCRAVTPFVAEQLRRLRLDGRVGELSDFPLDRV